MEMRNALSMALQEYTGAMLLVSHDRFLLRSTTDDLLLVANGQVEQFTGSVDDYEKWLLDYRKQQMASSEPKIKVARPKDSKPQLQKIKKLEDQIAKLEIKLNQLETKIAAPEIYEPQNQAKLQETLKEQTAVKTLLEKTENEWLAAGEERDKSD